MQESFVGRFFFGHSAWSGIFQSPLAGRFLDPILFALLLGATSSIPMSDGMLCRFFQFLY
jgi:hypothetical protein